MPPERDPQSEIEKLERRVAENPEGRMFAHLADAYRKAGELDQAERIILDGLEKHPDYVSAHLVLGRVYMDGGHVGQAQQQFRRTLELDPHNLIALKALGDLSVEQESIDEAESWYQRMLQVDPYNEEAQAALESLGQAGEVSGWDVEAAIPGSAGDEALADTGSASSISEDPTMPWSEAPSEAPEREESVEAPDFDPATAESEAGYPEDWAATPPGAPEAEESAGRTLDEEEDEFELDLGQMDGWSPGLVAEEDLSGETIEDEALELESREPEDEGVVTETMAELYSNQGLHQEALRIYRQLADVRPHDERIRERIRDLEEMMGEGDSATVEPPLEAVIGEDDPGAAEPSVAEVPGSKFGLDFDEPEGASEDTLADDVLETRAEVVPDTVAEAVGGEVVPADTSPSPTPPESGALRFQRPAPSEGLAEVDPFAASFDQALAGSESGMLMPSAQDAVTEKSATTYDFEPMVDEPEPVSEVEEVIDFETAPEPEAEPAVDLGSEPEPELAVEAGVEGGPDFRAVPGTDDDTLDQSRPVPDAGVEAPIDEETALGPEPSATELEAEVPAYATEETSLPGATGVPDSAEVERGPQTESIRSYLRRLLSHQPGSGQSGSGGANGANANPAASATQEPTAETDDGEPHADTDQDEPEDLAQFQEWLKSLKR